jgi:hypothetical protein
VTNGEVKCKFRISGGVQPGRARVGVSCERAGGASRTVLVVGSVIPARIVVVKDGCSVRQEPYGGGSVSWGVVLRNTSPNQDALDVYTLVNFVGPDNRLVGSATNKFSGIPAGKDFALGDDLSFFGGVPAISRLEVVIQIKKRQAHALKLPTITDIRIYPDLFRPDYVGEVDGEVSNDGPRLVLRNASLSTVVFDANGNVLGGGSGYAFASLPPSARASSSRSSAGSTRFRWAGRRARWSPPSARTTRPNGGSPGPSRRLPTRRRGRQRRRTDG